MVMTTAQAPPVGANLAAICISCDNPTGHTWEKQATTGLDRTFKRDHHELFVCINCKDLPMAYGRGEYADEPDTEEDEPHNNLACHNCGSTEWYGNTALSAYTDTRYYEQDEQAGDTIFLSFDGSDYGEVEATCSGCGAYFHGNVEVT
jgi:predicted nucleic-acid-binding Zn-ribbon protein